MTQELSFEIKSDEGVRKALEDLERHYKLIGKRDAFVGLLKFIENEGVCI